MRRSRRRKSGGSLSPLSPDDNDGAAERRARADSLRRQSSNPDNAVHLFQEPPSLTIGKLVTEADPQSKIGQRRKQELREADAEAVTVLGGGNGSSHIGTKKQADPNNNRSSSRASRRLANAGQPISGHFRRFVGCRTDTAVGGGFAARMEKDSQAPRGQFQKVFFENDMLGSGSGDARNAMMTGQITVEPQTVTLEGGGNATITTNNSLSSFPSEDSPSGSSSLRQYEHVDIIIMGAPADAMPKPDSSLPPSKVAIYMPPARGRTRSLRDAHSLPLPIRPLYLSVNIPPSKCLGAGLPGKRGMGSAALSGGRGVGNQSAKKRNFLGVSGNPRSEIPPGGAGAPQRNKHGLMTAQQVIQVHANRMGYMRSMGYGAKPMRSLQDSLNNGERAALEQGLQESGGVSSGQEARGAIYIGNPSVPSSPCAANTYVNGEEQGCFEGGFGVFDGLPNGGDDGDNSGGDVTYRSGSDSSARKIVRYGFGGYGSDYRGGDSGDGFGTASALSRYRSCSESRGGVVGPLSPPPPRLHHMGTFVGLNDCSNDTRKRNTRGRSRSSRGIRQVGGGLFAQLRSSRSPTRPCLGTPPSSLLSPSTSLSSSSTIVAKVQRARIVVIGDPGVGKTSLMHAYAEEVKLPGKDTDTAEVTTAAAPAAGNASCDAIPRSKQSSEVESFEEPHLSGGGGNGHGSDMAAAADDANGDDRIINFSKSSAGSCNAEQPTITDDLSPSFAWLPSLTSLPSAADEALEHAAVEGSSEIKSDKSLGLPEAATEAVRTSLAASACGIDSRRRSSSSSSKSSKSNGGGGSSGGGNRGDKRACDTDNDQCSCVVAGQQRQQLHEEGIMGVKYRVKSVSLFDPYKTEFPYQVQVWDMGTIMRPRRKPSSFNANLGNEGRQLRETGAAPPPPVSTMLPIPTLHYHHKELTRLLIDKRKKATGASVVEVQITTDTVPYANAPRFQLRKPASEFRGERFNGRQVLENDPEQYTSTLLTNEANQRLGRGGIISSQEAAFDVSHQAEGSTDGNGQDQTIARKICELEQARKDETNEKTRRAVVDAYLKGASGIVLTYDIGNAGTLDTIGHWLQRLRLLGISSAVPVLVICNKIDKATGSILNDPQSILQSSVAVISSNMPFTLPLPLPPSSSYLCCGGRRGASKASVMRHGLSPPRRGSESSSSPWSSSSTQGEVDGDNRSAHRRRHSIAAFFTGFTISSSSSSRRQQAPHQGQEEEDEVAAFASLTVTSSAHSEQRAHNWRQMGIFGALCVRRCSKVGGGGFARAVHEGGGCRGSDGEASSSLKLMNSNSDSAAEATAAAATVAAVQLSLLEQYPQVRLVRDLTRSRGLLPLELVSCATGENVDVAMNRLVMAIQCRRQDQQRVQDEEEEEAARQRCQNRSSSRRSRRMRSGSRSFSLRSPLSRNRAGSGNSGGVRSSSISSEARSCASGSSSGGSKSRIRNSKTETSNSGYGGVGDDANKNYHISDSDEGVDGRRMGGYSTMWGMRSFLDWGSSGARGGGGKSSWLRRMERPAKELQNSYDGFVAVSHISYHCHHLAQQRRRQLQQEPQ